jgi:hypothetical protein
MIVFLGTYWNTENSYMYPMLRKEKNILFYVYTPRIYATSLSFVTLKLVTYR